MEGLECRSVTAAYGRAEVLHGVSLQVGRGELVGLLGPNGAGKTTLLKAVGGVVSTSGSILVEGRPIEGEPDHRRPALGVGHCPEGRRLFGGLSVMKNLRLGAYSRTDAAGIAADLERVLKLFPRLREREGQLASTLSGGEQQMVAIGRALMCRPRVLLLDEPSVGIAQRLKETLFQAIRRICDEGVAVLLVEQDVRAALDIADRTYVLESGRIMAQGTKQDLSNQEHFRRAFFGL